MSHKRVILSLLSLLLFGGTIGQAQEKLSHPAGVVILEGLDKTTGHVVKIRVQPGEQTKFGSLRILVQACHKSDPSDPPEAAAFLEITDYPPDEKPTMIFSSWMYASNPALCALDHPVYDVWVKGCE